MSSIKRINAVFIYVKDMAEMRRFYETVLGLNAPIVESDMWVEYDLPGSRFALHQGDERILNEQSPLRNTVKFSLEVDDLSSLCASLKEKGVEIVFEPREDFGSLLAEILDVEGNPIRLIQKVK
ncbi:MAG: VOC family protein [Candidatus Omnitrophica bacterium]|nr:VOC family protein [Candidatus Omnitrophota bacterium]